MRHASILVVVLGCSDTAIVVQPVYEGPVDDPDATATNLGRLTLAVAHAGSLDDVVSQSFAPGQLVELANVPFANDLVVHLTSVDVAYGRTCSFALANTGIPAEPHLFFSRTVKFATIGSTSFSRVGGSAVTYHDGSAVLLGGKNDAGAVLAIERFDPRTGELHAMSKPLQDRTGAVTAVLGIGETSRIALIGGVVNNVGAQFVELIEVDSADAGQVDQITDSQQAMARVELTATSLTDGRVIAIGGRTPGGPPSGIIAEISIDAGSEIRALPTVLVHPRAGHTATRLGDDVGAPVLVVGGVDAAGAPIAVAELFKPLSGELAPPSFAPTMVVPRTKHQAKLMPDGSVLFIGGVDGAGMPVRTIERFTLDAGFVAVTGSLPVLAGVVDMTVTTMPDGRVLLAGGRTTPGGPPVADAFIARLDVIDGSVDVVDTNKLAVPRAGHQATLMCDGTVLVTGGVSDGQSQTSIERYNPPPLGRR